MMTDPAGSWNGGQLLDRGRAHRRVSERATIDWDFTQQEPA
jgi:hypothetical protein